MLRDMLVVGAGPAGILVWERRELIAQMKANCVAFAQAIERERAELFLLEDATSARHLFHEAGTCAIGAGTSAPCDPWGRLRAIDNIWVADASVFPSAGDRHPTLTVLAHALRVACSAGSRPDPHQH